MRRPLLHFLLIDSLLAAWLVVPSVSLGAAAPPNDNLNAAIVLTGTNVTTTGSSANATKEVGEPDHAGNPGGRSVWWKWTAPAAGSAVVDTAGSSFDTLLAVYTGASLGVLNSVASNDDAGSSQTSRLGFNVSAGAVYSIAVDGYDGAFGSIQLTITYHAAPLPNPPPNDAFARRLALEGTDAAATGTSFYATKEPKEPNHADELGGASVWWTWTAPISAWVVLDTEGSDFDTLLAVYTGSVLTNLTAVASNDSVSTSDLTSAVGFSAIAQTAYQIAVDGYNGEPGYIQLHLHMDQTIHLALAPRIPSGSFKITLTGPPGHQYSLETSLDLSHWSVFQTLTNATGQVDSTDLGVSRDPGRFYRARQSP